jgi:hypothetical protein
VNTPPTGNNTPLGGANQVNVQPNLNIPRERLQTRVDTQLVILKPGADPVVERGYAMRVQSKKVDLQPLTSPDRVYRAPGPVLGTTEFSVPSARGNLQYRAVLSENGLEIQPLSPYAATFLNGNQATVLRSGVLNAVEQLSANPGNIKTVYLNFN